MVSYFRSKERRVRSIVSKHEINRKLLKFFLKTSFLTIHSKSKINLISLGSLKHHLVYTTRSKNRCLLTNRSGAVFRYFRLSRIMIKNLASLGQLTGIQKSS